MNEHWTYDEASLDAFLRDEIAPGEKTRLQGHLDKCEQCRTRLEVEKALVEGVRTVGREELRGALRSMLLERSSRRSMALRWLAAAAVVAIILTVWQYPSGRDVPPSFTDLQGTDTTSEGAPRSETGSLPEADVIIADADRSEERPQVSRPTELSFPRREFRSEAAASGAGAVTPTGDVEGRVSGLADMSDESDDAVWSTAIVHSIEREREDAAPEAKAMKQEHRALAQAAEERPTSEPLGRTAVSNMRLEQSEFNAAPMTVQQNVPVQDDAQIPIRVRYKDDSTIVTIFPRVQLPAVDVRNSVATAVGDSVEVQVGSRVIRFGTRVLQRVIRR